MIEVLIILPALSQLTRLLHRRPPPAPRQPIPDPVSRRYQTRFGVRLPLLNMCSRIVVEMFGG